MEKKEKESGARPPVNDKRFWQRRETEPATEASRQPTVLAQLEEKISHLETALEQWKERVRQGQEEFRQFRARLEKDAAEQRERDRGQLLLQFLDLADHLEQLERTAVCSLPDHALAAGASLIRKDLQQLLNRLEVARLEPTGEPFDPRLHEAMELAETPAEQEGRVVETLRPGYRYKEQLLRPARVRVGRKTGGSGF